MTVSKKGRPTQGTIEKRGEAQWRARITVGGERRSKTFADQVSAESWVRDLRQAALRGQLPKLLRAQAMTLAEALNRYEDYECPPKSVSAVKSAIARLSETEAPLMAMALWDIDETDVGGLIQRRLAQGVMPATVNHDLTYIGRAFVLARTKWGYAKLHNPASKMKPRRPGFLLSALHGARELVELARAPPARCLMLGLRRSFKFQQPGFDDGPSPPPTGKVGDTNTRRHGVAAQDANVYRSCCGARTLGITQTKRQTQLLAVHQVVLHVDTPRDPEIRATTQVSTVCGYLLLSHEHNVCN